MKFNDLAVSYLHPENKPEHMLDSLRIGIIGRSEVVRPVVKHAAAAGLNISVMSPEGQNNPALRNATFTTGQPGSYGDVVAFGKSLDLVTVADESVDLNALRALSDMGVMVFPGAATVELIRDKYLMKDRMASHNIPVVKGWVVTNPGELMTYDGEHADASGQYGTADRHAGGLKLETVEAVPTGDGQSFLQEARLNVKKELTAIVSRNGSGVVECFAPALAIFDGDRVMADYSLCPASLGREVAMSACMLAARVAEAIDLTGTICVELIVAGNGKMYVNELGLRPYNGGMPGMNGAAVTTLERQLRAVLELESSGREGYQQHSLIEIPELQAHRKFALNEALKTVLSACNARFENGAMVSRKPYAFPLSALQMDEFISKAVIIKSLLGLK